MNLRHKSLNSKKGAAARSSNRTNADGANSRTLPPRTKSAANADGANSRSMPPRTQSASDGSDSHRSMTPTTNSDSVPANGANSGADVEMQGNRRGTERGREQPKKRGRKKRSRTQLKLPPRGRKVAILPQGDRQFRYVQFNPSDYKYSTQLGVILKREYPGIVLDMDEHGRTLHTRPALHWEDYYLNENDAGETNADRVKEEFWSLFSTTEELQDEADLVLENYADKRVNDIMYQLRVDAVKEYFWKKHGEELDDALARSYELEEQQYLDGFIEWAGEEAWPLLCSHWSGDQFLQKRKKAQESRLKSENDARNRGGSRPYTETQQWLEYKYGPEKATGVNTFAVMKSGAKNIDSSGSSGPVSCQKAQKIMDDYNTTVSSESQQNLAYNELDGKALYTIGGGLPHGRVPIGNGAVRKADVISAAKASNIRPSNTPSVRSVLRENAMLRRQLHVQSRQIRMLFEKIGEEPPLDEDLMSPLHGQRTGSSHAGSQPDLASFGNGDGDANIGCEGNEGNISCEGREGNISCEDRSNNGAS